MKLSELLQGINYTEIVGNPEREVSIVSQDSRDISQEGTLFCAILGIYHDGHDLIPQAIEKGAKTIVCERIPTDIDSSVTYVVVPHTDQALGFLASNFYGNPTQRLKVVGITGTNGKTTVANTTYTSLLQFDNARPLLLSTAGDFFNGSEISVERKTSSSIEPVELHRVLAHYLSQGATHVCLEVTSHGLNQYRANGIDFDIAIFTNLTQDHLDYHKTMEHYAMCKKRLFDMLGADAYAITNTDSEYGMYMIEDTQAHVISYGTNSNADYFISNITLAQEGQSFVLNDQKVESKQVGVFNAYNTAAAYIALRKLNYSEEQVLHAVSNVSAPKGRVEIIPNTQGVCAVVDYAHTPDALENVLTTLTELPHKRLITVFGCGGDRDTSKRPQMARIAQNYSDIVIVTSDNPRTEDPQRIINDILNGFSQEIQNYQSIENREEAIRKAVELADNGDIILVAGKGHEEYQIIGTETFPFSDQEVLKKYLL